MQPLEPAPNNSECAQSHPKHPARSQGINKLLTHPTAGCSWERSNKCGGKARSGSISAQKLCYQFLPSAIFFGKGSQRGVLHLCGHSSSLRRKITFFWQVFETGVQQAAWAGVTCSEPRFPTICSAPVHSSTARAQLFVPAHSTSGLEQLRGEDGSSPQQQPGSGRAGRWDRGNGGVCLHKDLFPEGKKTQTNPSGGIIGTGVSQY